MSDRKSRIKAALWGLFVADALAMPAHWYYSRENIRADFDGGITGYIDPPHPHPEAFMVGMGYFPDLEAARKHGRPYDTLHDHRKFYNTSWADVDVERNARETEHGNAVAAADERYHYHHGLKAGENTLNAHLTRVLMRSVITRGGYDSSAFLDDFIAYMTTPGLNPDPYQEVFLRRWFENWCGGAPAHASAQMQRDNWSIGSHGGMIRPMVLSMLSETPFVGMGMALEHQVLTHRSELLGSALAVCVPALFNLLSGQDSKKVFDAAARQIHLPDIRGEDLLAKYRDAKGPNNIPDDEMWALHMNLASKPLDLTPLINAGEQSVIRTELGTICYVEHGLPMMLFLATHEDYDLRKTLLLNVNAGGDNVNRGMPLGLLMGAAAGEIPKDLREGLADAKQLESEIEAFAEIAVNGQGNTTNFVAPSRRGKTVTL